MKTKYLITCIVLAGSMILSACSSSPTAPQNTQAPQATAAPAKATAVPGKTTPEYPAPNAPASQPTGYPAPDQSAGQPNNTNYPAPNSGLKITAVDGSAKVVDGAVMMTLTKSKVTLDGKELEVRKLADALKVAGIATYNKVSVNGTNGTLALTKEQVAQAYLDIAADGSIQLAVQGMSKDKWISGVQTLKID